jgi:hypothetical protein
MRAWSSDQEIVCVGRSLMHRPINAHNPVRERVACARPHHSSRATPDLSQLNRYL